MQARKDSATPANDVPEDVERADLCVRPSTRCLEYTAVCSAGAAFKPDWPAEKLRSAVGSWPFHRSGRDKPFRQRRCRGFAAPC